MKKPARRWIADTEAAVFCVEADSYEAAYERAYAILISLAGDEEACRQHEADQIIVIEDAGPSPAQD